MISLGTHRGCLTTEAEMRALTENYCPKHNEYFNRYCTGCRTSAGLKHFDKKRAEYLQDK